MSSVEVLVRDEGARRALAAALAAGRNTLPLMQDIGNLLVNQALERFELQRDPDGNDWAPLSLAYLSVRKNPDAPILTQQGYLKNSLTYLATRDLVETGSNLVYAAMQNFGGTGGPAWGSKDIPARTYMGLNQESEEEITALVMAHFGGAN